MSLIAEEPAKKKKKKVKAEPDEEKKKKKIKVEPNEDVVNGNGKIHTLWDMKKEIDSEDCNLLDAVKFWKQKDYVF